MNRKLFFFFAITIILISIYFFLLGRYNKVENNTVVSTINNKEFYLKIMKTPEERTRGLSGVNSMDKNSGMLFVFDKNDKHGIWMRDMLFPIDIIWLDEEKKLLIM